jgi:hypothetical protein
LRIDDLHATGQKRRASSPPGDEPTLHGMSSQSDLFRQRNIASRQSPMPRLGIQQGSITSTISTSRSGSNFSVASSMTSMNSYGRRSPGGLSPGGMSPVGTEASCPSPYTTPTSAASPRSSLARAPHQRNISQTQSLASPRKLNEASKANGAKMQDFYMCECCPKKPKKFETQEELR